MSVLDEKLQNLSAIAGGAASLEGESSEDAF